MINSIIQPILLLCVLLVVVSARPRFIAIPLEHFEVLKLNFPEPVRVARRAWSQEPQQDGREERQESVVRVARKVWDQELQQYGREQRQEPIAQVARRAWDQEPEQDGRVERQAHHEHVDYGAHTGHHGAFGWYADFPVTTHH